MQLKVLRNPNISSSISDAISEEEAKAFIEQHGFLDKLFIDMNDFRGRYNDDDYQERQKVDIS